MNVPELIMPENARAAIREQHRLAGLVRLEALPGVPPRVAGTDVAFVPSLNLTVAAVVVLDGASLELLEEATEVRPTVFPYIPGLLAYREIPALLACFGKLSSAPGLVLCDGQGLAHPRGFGLACHLGLLLDLPTLGCAKSHYVGEYEEPGLEAGSWSPLLFGGREIGSVVRTRRRVRPIWVSPGYRVTVQDATRLAITMTRRYRVPEPTRLAHQAAARAKVKIGEAGKDQS